MEVRKLRPRPLRVRLRISAGQRVEPQSGGWQLPGRAGAVGRPDVQRPVHPAGRLVVPLDDEAAAGHLLLGDQQRPSGPPPSSAVTLLTSGRPPARSSTEPRASDDLLGPSTRTGSSGIQCGGGAWARW